MNAPAVHPDIKLNDTPELATRYLDVGRDRSDYNGDGYGDLVQRVQQEGEREGELLYDDGSMDFHPVISPDGLKMAFLSNEGADFALTVLKVMDLNTRKVRRVADGGSTKRITPPQV